MKSQEIIGLLLLIANFGISYLGFTQKWYFDKYKFDVDAILIDKDYKRMITSGFLHVNWFHLIVNMIALYSFSYTLENDLGSLRFLLIYFTSLVGGSLLSLYIHRNHGDYAAAGASGAISGIIFASIVLYPHMEVGFPIFDFRFKGWLFGILFVAFTLFGIKSKMGNIGHEAHLGGALVGMLTALAFQPEAFSENTFTILLITIPIFIFLLLVIYKPEFLIIENFFSQKKNRADNNYSIDHKYNEGRQAKQDEIDRILDKIKRKGVESLSAKEKDFLDGKL